MSWLGALYNRQHNTVILERKEIHQGSSTTTPVLRLGKNIPVIQWAGFQAEYSGTAGLRRQKSEFSRLEEAGICKTGHQRRGSYIKEDLPKSIWRFSKSLWLRTGMHIHKTRLPVTDQRVQGWERNRDIISWPTLGDVGAAGNKSERCW